VIGLLGINSVEGSAGESGGRLKAGSQSPAFFKPKDPASTAFSFSGRDNGGGEAARPVQPPAFLVAGGWNSLPPPGGGG